MTSLPQRVRDTSGRDDGDGAVCDTNGRNDEDAAVCDTNGRDDDNDVAACTPRRRIGWVAGVRACEDGE